MASPPGQARAARPHQPMRYGRAAKTKKRRGGLIADDFFPKSQPGGLPARSILSSGSSRHSYSLTRAATVYVRRAAAHHRMRALCDLVLEPHAHLTESEREHLPRSSSHSRHEADRSCLPQELAGRRVAHVTAHVRGAPSERPELRRPRMCRPKRRSTAVAVVDGSEEL